LVVFPTPISTIQIQLYWRADSIVGRTSYFSVGTSLSFFAEQHVTTDPTSYLSLNIWPARLCINFGNGW